MPLQPTAVELGRSALALLLLAGVSCGGPGGSPAASSTVTPAPPAFRPESALASGCLGWPVREFSPDNHATVQAFLGPGDRAFDFTLRDVDGRVVTILALLAREGRVTGAQGRHAASPAPVR